MNRGVLAHWPAALAVSIAVVAPWFAGDPGVPAALPSAAQTLPPWTAVDEVRLADGALLRAPLIRVEAGVATVAVRGDERSFALPSAAETTRRRIVLGTDQQGRDLLARAAAAARVSLVVGLIALGTALATGALVGLARAFAPAPVRALLGLVIDAFLALPRLLLLLALAACFGGSAAGIGLAIGWGSWMSVARLIEERARALRAQDTTLAARAVGASPTRIALRHVLPHAWPAAAALAPVLAAEAVLIEASLSYLGFGAAGDSWGRMVAEGQRVLGLAPWVAIVPGTLLVLAALALDRRREPVSEHPY